MSSFFYGYLLTQIPGGLLAGRFGGKWVFGLGVLGTATLSLFTSVAAHASWYWLIALRFMQGVSEVRISSKLGWMNILIV